MGQPEGDVDGIEEVRKFFGTLYNTYSFFALYANVDGLAEREADLPMTSVRKSTDWMFTRLEYMVSKRGRDTCYNEYEPTKAGRLI